MIHYFYRQTEDWNKKNTTDFWYTRSTESYNNLTDFIKKWNKINKIDYFEFRKLLKKTSEKTFKESRIAPIYFEEIFNLNEDDWIIPFDDDDWFCSSFKERIEKTKEDFVFGDLLFFNIHSSEICYKKGDDQESLFSCQYAFKAKIIKEINICSLKNIINYHYLVKKEVLKNNLSYSYLPFLFSSRTFHLGSLDYLTRNKFNIDPKIYFSSISFSDSNIWCKPYYKYIKNYFAKKYI